MEYEILPRKVQVLVVSARWSAGNPESAIMHKKAPVIWEMAKRFFRGNEDIGRHIGSSCPTYGNAPKYRPAVSAVIDVVRLKETRYPMTRSAAKVPSTKPSRYESFRKTTRAA